MNRLYKTGIAALLAVAFPAVALARVALNMHGDPIVFSHDTHARMECITCHAATPSATPPASSVPMSLPTSCQSCHEITNQAPPSEGCVNCHNNQAQ